MARLTRHELKTDEFTARMEAIRDFFGENLKRLLMGSGVSLLVAGIVVAAFFYVRHRQAQAGEALARAMEAFHAPVTPTAPANPNLLYFKTAEEKYQEAAQRFTEVSGRFSRYSSGRWARYYSALSQRELGKLPEAEKELGSLTGEGNSELAAQAKVALANIYRESGRNAEAEKLYRELENHPTSTVPKVRVQLALAELYLKTNPPQAVEIFKQIQKDYPGTAVGDLATKVLQTLPQ